MSGGAIIAIIVLALIVGGAAGAAAMFSIRQQQLRKRFGPEYDRLVAEYRSRRKATAELARRQRRVRDLDLKELSPEARTRYLDEWAAVQEQFVDAPQRTVGQAQQLVMTVMNECGYPTEQDDQILEDLSVDHARVLDHYRVATAFSQRAAAGTASTEDSRQAVIHYRVLFRDLLGERPQPSGVEEAPVPAVTEAGEAGETSPAGTDDAALAKSEEATPAEAEAAEAAPAEAEAAEPAPAPAETEAAAPAEPQETVPAAETEEATPARTQNGAAPTTAGTVRE
jgi:hypothetical protein